MTIDEAIKHCEEVAEKQEYLSKKDHGYCEEKWNIKKRAECAECAADHRQLASWLRELKDLREENRVLMQECDRLIKEKGKIFKEGRRADNG